MVIKQLDHVVVYVSDMDKAIDFYVNKLGLPLRNQSSHWSEVGGETVYIGLHLSDRIKKTKEDTTDICFLVDNIEKGRLELEKRSISFYDDITQISPTSWFTSFTDLDGNKLSIYAKK